MEKISINVNANPEQISEMKRLSKLSKTTNRGDRTGNVLGKYLIKNYGQEISDKLSKQQVDDTDTK